MSGRTSVFVHVFGDGFHFPLLAIGASEFQTTDLEGHKAVADLDDVDEAVQVVTGQDEKVPVRHVTPFAQSDVTTETLLEGMRQVLVEDGVEVIVVITCHG